MRRLARRAPGLDRCATLSASSAERRAFVFLGGERRWAVSSGDNMRTLNRFRRSQSLLFDTTRTAAAPRPRRVGPLWPHAGQTEIDVMRLSGSVVPSWSPVKR
jgi:hypothetical protein